VPFVTRSTLDVSSPRSATGVAVVVPEAAAHEHVLEARAGVRARDEGVLRALAGRLAGAVATTIFAIARHEASLPTAIQQVEFLAKVLSTFFRRPSACAQLSITTQEDGTILNLTDESRQPQQKNRPPRRALVRSKHVGLQRHVRDGQQLHRPQHGGRLRAVRGQPDVRQLAQEPQQGTACARAALLRRRSELL